MRLPVAVAVGLACGPVGGCSDTASPLAPRGEALVFVDTDLPVPSVVDRLRVDVYRSDGATWTSSNDFLLGDPAQWPASFAVVSDDPQSDVLALVRLRAYEDDRVRDYVGERFLPRIDPASLCDQSSCTGTSPPSCCPNVVPSPSTPFATADCSTCPRLLRADGSDVTPASEPAPSIAIDRLLLLRIRPGVVGAVSVTLTGACSGTMADVAGARSCVDTDGQLIALVESPLASDLAGPGPSVAGSFHAQPDPCTATPRARGTAADGTPLYDEEVCVDGGTFVLGNANGFGSGQYSDWPQRLAIIPPLRIDKYEVTVGRWRDAVARGFQSPQIPYARTTVTDPLAGGCTWTASPSGLEDQPLVCVDWAGARAFCRFEGADLPTEAEWEYVATAAGRTLPTAYPWGDDPPACARAVWGRGQSLSFGTQDLTCNPQGTQYGTLPVVARDSASGDVAPSGVVDLGGNASEFTLDDAVSMESRCWAAASQTSPTCQTRSAQQVTTRGGEWDRQQGVTAISIRGTTLPVRSATSGAGLRCVRPGVGP